MAIHTRSTIGFSQIGFKGWSKARCEEYILIRKNIKKTGRLIANRFGVYESVNKSNLFH